MSASGGVGTAAGLGYQYLVAVEDVLDWMARHSSEDFTLESEDHVSDIVDYSITNKDGIRLLSVQAKSSVDGPSGTSLGAPELARIFLRLIEHDARRYAIRTNRRLTESGEALLKALSSLDVSAENSSNAIEVVQPFIDSDRLSQAIDSGTDFSRLVRCAVLSEPLDVDTLRSRIAEKVRQLRRLRGDGAGRQAAEVLVGYLTSQILHLSSRRAGRRIDRAGLDQLVGTSAAVLAGAVGEVDWGTPIGPVPTTRTVERTATLTAITEKFAGPPVETGRRVALTGLSGIGKSTIARVYMDAARHYYDRILWIDAHSAESIREAISAYVGIDINDVSTDIVVERFKATISSAPVTWLLIFDNLPDDRTVAPWLPVVGPIDVIATSTNSTGWSQWQRERLLPMTDSEALALVCERLDLDRIDADAERDARELCDALGNWPLAIELACGFLFGSGRGLAMTGGYLYRLKEHIIDDQTLVPPEYRSHPSLLQAISVALETVASSDSKMPIRAVALLETLAYLPPRSAPLQLAGRVTARVESIAGRYRVTEDVATEHDVEIAVRQLLTASLIHRVQAREVRWGDLVRTNEIILEVVSGRHSDIARSRVLAVLQQELNDGIQSAVENYTFAVAELLTTSALTTIDFSERFRIHSREGITLIGNLAAMFSNRGDPDAALPLYRQELKTLDQLGINAPILRAKIYSGISALQIRTNAPVKEIRPTIDYALYYLGRCAVDPDARNSVVDAAKQVYENIQLLASLDSGLDTEVTESWILFLFDSYPEAEKGLSIREFHAQLRSLNNDDTATLAVIEERLQVEGSSAMRLQLFFLRADALASLGRFGQSIDAFREALAWADERAIGLGAGWVETLNAWRTAAFRVLESFDLNALDFCRRMDSLVEGQQPTQADDGVTVELCRIVTRVLDRDLKETVVRLESLATQVILPTLLTPNIDGMRLAIAACNQIAQLRRSVDGAPIVPLDAWGRGQILGPHGWQKVITLALDLTQINELPASGLTGRWIHDELGTGLLIIGDAPVLVWAATSDTWWMGHEEANADSANLRLREVIASPEFAAYQANVLVGSSYIGSEGHLIDPNGPTISIAVYG